MTASPTFRFRLLGFPIAIGIAFPAVMTVLGLLSRRSGEYLVEWVVLGVLAILLHELGHALALRRFGVAASITFWGLGGMTEPEPEAADRLSAGQSLVVFAAGPVVGIVLGAIVLAAQPVVASQDRFVRILVSDWIFMNLGWALFNLLPIAGLDGSGVLQNLGALAFGRRGIAAAFLLSMLASAGIAILAIQAHLIFLAAIAVGFGLLNPAAYRGLAEAMRPNEPAARQEGPPAE